jgi:hypothetical protein
VIATHAEWAESLTLLDEVELAALNAARSGPNPSRLTDLRAELLAHVSREAAALWLETTVRQVRIHALVNALAFARHAGGEEIAPPVHPVPPGVDASSGAVAELLYYPHALDAACAAVARVLRSSD